MDCDLLSVSISSVLSPGTLYAQFGCSPNNLQSSAPLKSAPVCKGLTSELSCVWEMQRHLLLNFVLFIIQTSATHGVRHIELATLSQKLSPLGEGRLRNSLH